MSTLLPLFVLTLLATAPQNGDADLAAHFADAGVEGTLVLASLDGETQFVHNPERAARRYCPASTFKIPNTLIALETGALKDKDELLKWDGKKHQFADWNKDQTLASAFAASCVWNSTSAWPRKLATRVTESSLSASTTATRAPAAMWRDSGWMIR